MKRLPFWFYLYGFIAGGTSIFLFSFPFSFGLQDSSWWMSKLDNFTSTVLSLSIFCGVISLIFGYLWLFFGSIGAAFNKIWGITLSLLGVKSIIFSFFFVIIIDFIGILATDNSILELLIFLSINSIIIILGVISTRKATRRLQDSKNKNRDSEHFKGQF